MNMQPCASFSFLFFLAEAGRLHCGEMYGMNSEYKALGFLEV